MPEPTPKPWSWPRLVAVTLARAVLVGFLGLAAWGSLPAVVGWHPTTVSSGSMLPRLHVGDVAVSRPLGGHAPPLGSVLLFHDPDHPGRLRLHRFVRLEDDGLLVTRGDANAGDDSSPVTLGAVEGIGTLRVPWLGLPVFWLRDGSWLALGLTAAGLGLLLVVAVSGRDRTFAEDEAPEDEPPDEDAEAGAGPADAVPGVVDDGVRWSRPTLLRRGVALAVAGLVVLGPAVPAGAAFRATTATRADLGAATYFTCASGVASLSPYLWYRMDETSDTTTSATDSSGNTRTGVYSSGDKTSVRGQACTNDSGRAMRFSGSGYLSSPAVAGGMPNTFSLSIWFRTTTTTGGKIIGFGSAQTGQSGNYDRHIYMSDDGRLYYGVYANATKTISSTASYNDGGWHLAVATLSSAGMRLYVDGKLLVRDTTTTTGEPGSTAYVRIAFDNVGNWPSSPSSPYFSGTLDDAALFTTALSAAQVSALYEAGTA